MEKVLLTKAVADAFLSKNYASNRTVRPVVVKRYVDDIISGNWCEDDTLMRQNCIMFNTDGYMINGQHRCYAVSICNRPIHVYVENNVSDGIFQYLDGGEPRRAFDYIDLPYKNQIAALAAIACAIDDGTASLRYAINGRMDTAGLHPTRARILDKVEGHSDLFCSLVQRGRGIQAKTKISIVQSSAALYILNFCECDDYADRFIDDLLMPVSDSPTNTALKEFLLRTKAENKNMERHLKVSAILHAYDHFLPGTEIKTFARYRTALSKYDNLVAKKREQLQAKRKEGVQP